MVCKNRVVQVSKQAVCRTLKFKMVAFLHLGMHYQQKALYCIVCESEKMTDTNDFQKGNCSNVVYTMEYLLIFIGTERWL